MKPCAKAFRMGLFIALAVVLLVAVSACGQRQATDTRNAPNVSPSPATGGVHQAGQDAGMGTLNDTADSPAAQNVEISQSIADAIAGMDEVESANVLVADNNAYVAVVLERGAGKPLGASPSPGQSPEASPGAANTPAAQAESDDAAGDVTDELKNRIAQKAQSVNTNIKRVYVSASPDFVERMNTFRQDIQNGRPAAGFIKEFYTVVERLFPTRAGQNNPVVAP